MAVEERLRASLSSGGRPWLLDAGCGTGEMVAALARRYPRVEFVGLDFAGAVIEAPRNGVDVPNLHYVQGGVYLSPRIFPGHRSKEAPVATTTGAPFVRRHVFLAVGIAVLSLASSAASAVVVFDNGARESDTGGINVTIRVIADDFVFVEGPVTVTGGRFWALGTDWDHKLDYFFFESAPGGVIPTDTAFFQGSDVNANRTLITGFGAFALYEYEFTLSQPLVLEANTRYWFGLHLKADFGAGNEVFWSTTEVGFDFSSATTDNGSGDFSTFGSAPLTHAWQLLPEPGGALSALGSLAALGAIGRVRRRAATGSGL